MTAQINDSVLYGKHAYAIVGIKGEGLFDPAKEGIRLGAMHTACWRGYIATYGIVDQELRLRKLELRFAADQEDAPVFGAMPKKVGEHRSATYQEIPTRVPFTGGLLLGDDFVRALYVHMGFHPAWKYRKVVELIIEDGKVLREHDRSEAMAALRERLTKQPLEPGAASEAVIREWVKKCFEREY